MKLVHHGVHEVHVWLHHVGVGCGRQFLDKTTKLPNVANVLPDKLTVLRGNKHFTNTKVLDTPMGNLPHTMVIAFNPLSPKSD